MPMSLALGGGVGSVPARPSPYAVETRRVLARWQALEVGASDARAAWLDAVVVRPLVAEGVLAASDRLFMPGRAHAELAARVNLASPGTGDLVPHNPDGFTADVGYNCDGVDDFLACSLAIATDFAGTLFKLDSAHLWGRVGALTVSTSRPIWGQSSGTTTLRLLLGSDTTLQANLNGSTAVFGAVANSGFFLANRVNSTNIRGYADNVLVSEQAVTSAAPSAARTMVLMRANAVYTDGVLQAAGIGAGLTDDQRGAIAAVLTAAWAEAPPA